MSKALVMGVGNFLLSDEGFGVHVVKEFEKNYRIPPEVEVVDGGCLGFSIADYLREKDLVLLIDVMAEEAPPGSYRILSAEELKNFPEVRVSSCHQVTLVEALRFVEFVGLRPEKFKVFAAVPEILSPGIELSPALRQTLPLALKWLERELISAGFRVEKSPCA